MNKYYSYNSVWKSPLMLWDRFDGDLLSLWVEAPVLDGGSGFFLRLDLGDAAHLLGHVHTLLHRLEAGHQLGHVSAHLHAVTVVIKLCQRMQNNDVRWWKWSKWMKYYDVRVKRMKSNDLRWVRCKKFKCTFWGSRSHSSTGLATTAALTWFSQAWH